MCIVPGNHLRGYLTSLRRVRSEIAISRIAVPDSRRYMAAILATCPRLCNGAEWCALPRVIRSRANPLLIASIQIQERVTVQGLVGPPIASAAPRARRADPPGGGSREFFLMRVTRFCCSTATCLDSSKRARCSARCRRIRSIQVRGIRGTSANKNVRDAFVVLECPNPAPFPLLNTSKPLNEPRGCIV